jgi:hypothetical protein
MFDVPVVPTTVETKSFSGNLWPQIRAVFSHQEPSRAWILDQAGGWESSKICWTQARNPDLNAIALQLRQTAATN